MACFRRKMSLSFELKQKKLPWDAQVEKLKDRWETAGGVSHYLIYIIMFSNARRQYKYLYIFLDNLQWADPASMGVIQNLCIDNGSCIIRLSTDRDIGAYLER